MSAILRCQAKIAFMNQLNALSYRASTMEGRLMSEVDALKKLRSAADGEMQRLSIISEECTPRAKVRRRTIPRR